MNGSLGAKPLEFGFARAKYFSIAHFSTLTGMIEGDFSFTSSG